MDEPVNETVEEPEVDDQETEPVDDEPHEGVEAAPEEALVRTKRIREYPVELSVGDGRTIDAKIVPYNTPADVADPPFFAPYKEEFLPGAFDKQMRAADRVKIWLNFEHEQGLRGVVGHGVDLQNDGNFLRGSFRVHENADGDKALQLVNEGLLTGLSAEFVPMKSKRSANGVVQRVRAHLDRVALCRFPAYKDAQIVAVRTKPVLNELVVPVASPELTDRLAALGVTPIERIAVTYKHWDPTPDRFTEEEFAAACLIDREGDAAPKERCALPVLEPDGTLNVNALDYAASLLQRSAVPKITPQLRQEAARTLLRFYRKAQHEPPTVVMSLARGKGITTTAPLRRIALSRKPWDGSAARFTDEQYRQSCLIDRGGGASVKERCSIPVLEPDGSLNINALGPAAAALSGGRTPLVGVTESMKAAAARKLIRYYGMAGQTPPDSLRALADSGATTAARAASLERAVSAAEEKAVGHLETMITACKAYISSEPDAQDKAMMGRVLGMLQGLRNKDMAEGGAMAS